MQLLDFLNEVYDKNIVDNIIGVSSRPGSKIGSFNGGLCTKTQQSDVLVIFQDYINVHNPLGKKINYYNNKVYTRFILISISTFYCSGNTSDFVKKYRFNQSGLWQLEHIVPRKQECHHWSANNKKWKNCLGNLALLQKETNVKISNSTFYSKKSKIPQKEMNLEVNDIFNSSKVHLSINDIKSRDKTLKDKLNKIFFDGNGQLFKVKLQDFWL